MRPAAGVECRDCRVKKGHRCQAQIYDDGVALCLPCADGDPCVVDRVGAPPAPTTDDGLWESDLPPAPVIRRTAEELGIAATVAAAREEKIPVSARLSEPARREQLERAHAAMRRTLRAKAAVRAAEKKTIAGEEVRMSSGVVMGPEMIAPEKREPLNVEERRRRAEEIRAVVREHAGSMSDKEIAKLAGCSDGRVWQIRQELPQATQRKGGRQPVSSELVQQIVAEDASIPAKELAQKYRLSKSAICVIRQRNGIVSRAKKGPRSAARGELQPGQRAITIDTRGQAAIDRLIEPAPQPVLCDEPRIEVALSLLPAQAAALFAALSPLQQGAALRAAFLVGR